MCTFAGIQKILSLDRCDLPRLQVLQTPSFYALSVAVLKTCTRTENMLKNFHKHFLFIHNAYILDQVIVNVAKYSNLEYFQNITFGSALHRRAGKFAISNIVLPKCWCFLHVSDFLINRYMLEGFQKALQFIAIVY